MLNIKGQETERYRAALLIVTAADAISEIGVRPSATIRLVLQLPIKHLLSKQLN